MTLPFRRRHNDAEASHDRARSIIATGFLEPTEPADDAWLETHLEGCADCLAELHGYAADRELLRTLRTTIPEPPRDLWARTAASIERDAGRHERAGRAGHASRGGPRLARIPIGVLSGVLVILVVVATSLFPPNGFSPVEPSPPAGTRIADATPPLQPTPLAVTARLSWVEESSDGTFQLVFADVSEVCVSDPEACAPLQDGSTTRLTLADEPESMVLAPGSDQLVVVTKAAETGGGGGEVIVVPIATPEPSFSPGDTPGPTLPPSPTPEATPTPEVTPTLGPGETPGPTPVPTSTPNPDGSWSILSNVVVVGEAAYSESGEWLAFSARPVDGTTGPDLYTWRVGDPLGAQPATSDHRTFFAGWLGELILASRVVTAATDEPLESPAASGAPSVEPATTAKPGRTPDPGKSPKPGASGPSASPAGSPSASPAASPAGSPDGSPAPAEDHPVSFLLDPTTSPATVIELAGRDIWRPVVNTESGTIVYWSGTLVADETATGWNLGAGQLVLDGWVDPTVTPDQSPDPSRNQSPDPSRDASPDASPDPSASIDPLASSIPTPPPGPAGNPVVLAEGPVRDFDVRFDPTGTRLAVWIRDPENADVGTLRLVAIDPLTRAIDPALDPLPAATALHGFSIGDGRLAWVTPPGQDGEASHVHVLAWSGNDFGEVRSTASDRVFVVR